MVTEYTTTQISALKRFKIDDINKFIEKLTGSNTVYVPQKVGENIEFREYGPNTKIQWDFSNSEIPPKKVIFPQTEEMFRYSYAKGEKGTSVEPPESSVSPSIIAGIRPCDAHAMTKTDHNFKGEFLDPYYLNKRQNTILIGLACDIPDFNCFCTSMEGGPYSRIGLDALLIKTSDSYIIEILTEAGMKIEDSIKELLQPPPENIEETISDQEQKAVANIQRHVDLEGLEISILDIFADEMWRETAQRCISCGICVFLCPTCRCFDIQDEATSTKGRRIRVWDSCQFPEYTVHASGYNPRPERTNRYRNRILCRLKYTKDKFGVGYCTGCGRCITKCPVNIDILEAYIELRQRIESKGTGGAEMCSDSGSAEVKN